jgi:hypothetical protein
MSKLKVALIGASGYATVTDTHRLDSFGWFQLDKLSNLRDYDAVVISLLEGRPDENAVHVWNRLTTQLNARSCREITMNGGKIIIVGDPRFKISITQETQAGTRLPVPYNFLDFTRGAFEWDAHGGDSVNVENTSMPDGVREYLRHLRRWNYALREAVIYGTDHDLLHTRFASNRYDLTLAGSFLDYGNLFLLPEISLSPDATLRLVLQQIIGVELAEDAEPPWTNDVVCVGQEPIDHAIAESEAEIERLKQKIDRLRDERTAVREPVRLLYLRGTPLEQIVRKTMAALGAKVREPTEAGDEDGWIEYNGQHGVLEVKTAGGPTFGEEGIAQLTKWMLKDVDLNAKAIFVGLANAGQRPSEASPFGQNFARNAARFGIVAMQTKDLFLAHELMLQGKLTPAEFWPTVFDTNGIYSDTFLKSRIGS